MKNLNVHFSPVKIMQNLWFDQQFVELAQGQPVWKKTSPFRGTEDQQEDGEAFSPTSVNIQSNVFGGRELADAATPLFVCALKILKLRRIEERTC